MRAHKNITAEIDSSPRGPSVGAFFDFDGTVIAGFSGLTFMKAQILRREMSAIDIAKASRAMLDFSRGKISFLEMMSTNAQFMAGEKEAAYIRLGEELFDKEICKNIYPESAALIQAHLNKGHTVAIVSSATRYQVEPAAHYLGVEHVLCSDLELVDGKFSGEVIQPVCFGEGKVIAAEKLANEKDIDFSKSYFYSDSDDDIELLEKVGNPRPLNPNTRLCEIAEARNWPVRHFSSRGAAKASTWIRSIAATGSMLTSVASSVPIKMLTGSMREAQNFSAAMFSETASALAGIKLDIQGEKNLWSHRPAVFIFNHQSKADLIITAKLLHKDFAGVARKHGKGTSLYDKAMEFGGIVMIDKADGRAAIKSLKPLVNGLKNENRSVVIAPEGTRSHSTKIGEFKKGAFHIAMQAGVPIVPIVIHNSIDVCPKGDFLYHSATVCVDVLPPIDTSDWTRKNMDERIEKIRDLYIEALQ